MYVLDQQMQKIGSTTQDAANDYVFFQTILNKYLFIRSEILEHPEDDEVCMCVCRDAVETKAASECVRPCILFF